MKGDLGEVIIRAGIRTYKKCYLGERAVEYDVEGSANLCEEESLNKFFCILDHPHAGSHKYYDKSKKVTK